MRFWLGKPESLVADFDQHLAKVCGLSPATRFHRRRYAREFLEWRFERKRWDLTKLCFADFVDYVKFRAPRLKPASVGVMITSLRSLVRFLEFEGRCRTGLSALLPADSYVPARVPASKNVLLVELAVFPGISSFLRANLRLGIFGRQRFQYWSLLLWYSFRRPNLSFLAVTLSIYGQHFRETCRVLAL